MHYTTRIPGIMVYKVMQHFYHQQQDPRMMYTATSGLPAGREFLDVLQVSLGLRRLISGYIRNCEPETPTFAKQLQEEQP